jgi:ABC-type transporter Mla subunit MlaD
MKLPFRRSGRKKPMSNVKAGGILAILIVVFTYLGFTKFSLPFNTQYTANVVFQNANQLRPGSLVRIAGVNVGKVDKVQEVPGCKSTVSTPTQCSAAQVNMTIQKIGLPLHKDATFWIRPRIFLEGNFFVDINPGSPSAPVAPSGYTWPSSQTRNPVQFDQILTSLQENTRENLQILLQQYGKAVKQGGPAYNSSIQYWLPAYEYSSLVEHDMLGIQPHDLSNAIYSQGDVSAALDAHPQALQSLITDFNTTARAFAVERAALARAVGDLPQTLNVAIPTFQALNRDFCAGPMLPNCPEGPLPKLARALIPATVSTGPMVDTNLPFLKQLRGLLQPSELGAGCQAGQAIPCGLTYYLGGPPGHPELGAVEALARLTVETIPFMRNQVRPLSACSANEIYPWSQLTLNDPHFNSSNGFPPRKVYVEAVDFLPGLAGESRNFDANGPYIRILGALGNAGVTSLQSGLVGGTLAPLVGFQPTVPPGGHNPPLQPNVPCESQPPITDLTAGSQQAPTPVSPTTPASLLGLLPLPQLPLPLGLSSDSKHPGAGSKPTRAVTAQMLAAARQQLLKQGLFEMSTQPPSTGQSSARPGTAVRTSTKPGTAVRTSTKPHKAASAG